MKLIPCSRVTRLTGRLLKTGSANWSPTGLKRQDNNVRYESSPEAAEQLEEKSPRCGSIPLPEPPSEWKGERHCAKCQPRLHRVLMNFQQHNAWDLSFLEGDCKTVIGRRFDVSTDEQLFALAERGGADLKELRESIARWNKGSAWLNLTEQQYRRLLRAERQRQAVVKAKT